MLSHMLVAVMLLPVVLLFCLAVSVVYCVLLEQCFCHVWVWRWCSARRGCAKKANRINTNPHHVGKQKDNHK